MVHSFSRHLYITLQRFRGTSGQRLQGIHPTFLPHCSPTKLKTELLKARGVKIFTFPALQEIRSMPHYALKGPQTYFPISTTTSHVSIMEGALETHTPFSFPPALLLPRDKTGFLQHLYQAECMPCPKTLWSKLAGLAPWCIKRPFGIQKERVNKQMHKNLYL